MHPRRNQTCSSISQATWNGYQQAVWSAATAQGLDPTSYGSTVFAFPNLLGTCWAGLAIIGCYGDYTCWTCATSGQSGPDLSQGLPIPRIIALRCHGTCRIPGRTLRPAHRLPRVALTILPQPSCRYLSGSSAMNTAVIVHEMGHKCASPAH